LLAYIALAANSRRDIMRVCACSTVDVRLQYFACADNHGTIVVPDKVTIVEASSLSVFHMRAWGGTTKNTKNRHFRRVCASLPAPRPSHRSV